jgi:hypothetical protein
MKNNRLFFFLLLVAACLLCACKTIPRNVPEGFAAYKGNGIFRAVSSDGVMYRIRNEENKPFAELPFWKTALKKHMLDSGYRFIGESDITSDGRPGYQLELSAPLGDKDYIYLIALFVNGDRLVIAEASGEAVTFRKHRDSVTAAVSRMDWGK